MKFLKKESTIFKGNTKNTTRARPFYWPPGLPFRQAASAFYYAALTGWNGVWRWAAKAPQTMHIAAGAVGMGCIGFPNHPVWEATSACNLKCRHCHNAGGTPSPGELSTEEAKRMLREIASIDQFRMMVFTGGEPLVRPDLFKLCEYSASLNLPPVIATNGTLITPHVARRLRDCGVACIAVSLDGKASFHNELRGSSKAYELALQGIENWRSLKMPLQINITAMKENLRQIPDLLQQAEAFNTSIVLIYQLIPVGRGDDIKNCMLTREENTYLLETIYKMQEKLNYIVEPVGSPQCWPYLVSRKKTGSVGEYLARTVFKGCTAGSGLCYIKADGEVWPCPFLPFAAGNVKNKSLGEIWKNGETFALLRNRNNLKGQCRDCRYREMCGGCRGRAYALSGDIMGDDPSCFFYKRETE